MSYLVLARKWRPTRFDDVVGQRHVTQTLQNSIRHERVPHALLFIGSRGVGKTSCARIFAKALNCLSEPKPVPTPCDACPSCESVNQGASVDVYEIDGASNNGVEQVRELRESTQFKPSISRFKIYIIDEVHMLSVGAFNALLKTLEEPPPHVKFIFATTEPHKIPDTIISRCQRFDFKRISSRDIVDALARISEAEGVNAERPALEHVAREAQGGMRDSLSLLDQLISFCGAEITEAKAREVLGLTSREMMLELLGALFKQDAGAVISLIQEHAESGADLKRLSAELLEVIRDLMVMKVHPQPQQVLELPPSELELMARYVEPMQVGALHHTFQTLAERADEIQRSPYPKLLLEMTLLQMCHQADSAMLSEVMGGLLQLETHLNEIGLREGLSPIVTPPSYRPPYASPQRRGAAPVLTEPLSAPELPPPVSSLQPHIQSVASPSAPSPEVTPPGGEAGISRAQSDATAAALSHGSPHAQPGRSQPHQPHQPYHSAEPRSIPQPPQQPPQHIQQPPQQPPQQSPQQSLSRAQEAPTRGQRPSTPPQEAHAPVMLLPEGSRPRHPALPSDPETPPRFGEGVSAQTYEWMLHFNHWLAERDTFFASEMRLRSRILYWGRAEESLKLTLGGPPQMWDTIRQHFDEVYAQLIESAAAVNVELPQAQLELELVDLPEDDPHWALASLRDYLKHQVTQRALAEVSEAVASDYVSQHLSALGGQVIYVIPDALQTQV